MNKLNKILGVLFIFSFFALNLTLAQVDYIDCNNFARMDYKQFYSQDGQNSFTVVTNNRETNSKDAIYSNFLDEKIQKKIITKDDLNTAMLNLKHYCCISERGGVDKKTCENDINFYNTNHLDSPYLYDHIFDVMMRRLAGLTGDRELYTKTGMTEVDEKGGERRKYITKVALDLSGSDVQSIVDKYQEFWVKSEPSLGYDINEIKDFNEESIQNLLEFVSGQGGSEDSKKVAEAIKNYEKWSLYDRYSNTCAMSLYLYALLNQGVLNSKRSIKGYEACQKFVQAQIENENVYVQIVAQNSANLFMENYVEGYFQYLYDRGTKLKTLRKNVEDRWMDVIRAVPFLVKSCVK